MAAFLLLAGVGAGEAALHVEVRLRALAAGSVGWCKAGKLP